MIIGHIIECTDEKYRVYNDKRYNPDISLNILENAFAITLFRELNSVSIENVSDAIKRSEFLYKGPRADLAKELLLKYDAINADDPSSHEPTEYIKCKTIPLSSHKNRKFISKK